MEPIGIYIHVPFCGQKCPYCDFYSLPASEETKSSYVHACSRIWNAIETGDS